MKDINKIKELIKDHITLKLYIMYAGFGSVILLILDEILAGLVLGLYMFLALAMHEKYKEKLHLD